MLEHIASILSAVAWPAAVVWVALLFRQEFRKIISGFGQDRRNVRLKYGNFELEAKYVEQIEQHLKLIAEEPDPRKRQELATLKSALSLSLQGLDPEADRMLVWLAKNQLSNCTHVNWHSPPEGLKYESLKQLSEHGLVHVESMYDGDELIGIHPIVREFIASRENGENA